MKGVCKIVRCGRGQKKGVTARVCKGVQKHTLHSTQSHASKGIQKFEEYRTASRSAEHRKCATHYIYKCVTLRCTVCTLQKVEARMNYMGNGFDNRQAHKPGVMSKNRISLSLLNLKQLQSTQWLRNALITGFESFRGYYIHIINTISSNYVSMFPHVGTYQAK